MSAKPPEPLLRKFDCLQIPVPDLEAGLAFYRDLLGHPLIWRTATAAGLRLPDSDAEIVLQPVTREYIRWACGLLEDAGPATPALLQARRRDRRREEARGGKPRSR